jgi:hypothetical protein
MRFHFHTPLAAVIYLLAWAAILIAPQLSLQAQQRGGAFAPPPAASKTNPSSSTPTWFLYGSASRIKRGALSRG